MRKYKTGTRWCIWRWSEVDSGFIKRLHLIKTPFGAICIHWLLKGDPEPYLHDHPVTFLSVILRGGYTELRTKPGHCGPRTDNPGSPFDRVKRRWFNWITAGYEDRHTITDVEPNTVTLCFMGPKIREWGYHTEAGWVYWKDYNDAKYKRPTQ
jgi:hypothetical protein